MQDLSLFDLKEIYKARKRIKPFVSLTSLQVSEVLSESLGSDVRLKLENQQVTGAFKLRGAANKILQLSEEQKSRGVITVSSGNHGRAVAYISRELGLKAVIVISEAVPENKREAIRRLGAELLVGGPVQDEAMDFADRLQKERGLTMVHPFDDLQVIAGQGTIALELLEEYPELDTVLVPLSGGGLCGGIAFAL
jgi:threonine dehydratase